jgi:hypothetical protein
VNNGMPIQDTRFENNIFYCREVGDISKVDALGWVALLRQYAATNPTPIGVLIDANDVTFISVDARMIFARSAQTPNVKAAAIVNTNPVVSQFVRMIELMSQAHNKYMFETVVEAEAFLKAQVNPTIAAHR